MDEPVSKKVKMDVEDGEILSDSEARVFRRKKFKFLYFGQILENSEIIKNIKFSSRIQNLKNLENFKF